MSLRNCDTNFNFIKRIFFKKKIKEKKTHDKFIKFKNREKANELGFI